MDVGLGVDLPLISLLCFKRGVIVREIVMSNMLTVLSLRSRPPSRKPTVFLTWRYCQGNRDVKYVESSNS